MSHYTFDTTLFGALKVPADEGILEEFTITLGGQEISTYLYIMEAFINETNKGDVQFFLDQIPKMYEIAKTTLTECCGTDATVVYFIESSLEEGDDEYQEYLTETFGVDSVDEITKEEFIEELQPRCIRIGLNSEGKVDCVFDFSLDEEYTDELLVVYFDTALAVTDISHES